MKYYSHLPFIPNPIWSTALILANPNREIATIDITIIELAFLTGHYYSLILLAIVHETIKAKPPLRRQL